MRHQRCLLCSLEEEFGKRRNDNESNTNLVDVQLQFSTYAHAEHEENYCFEHGPLGAGLLPYGLACWPGEFDLLCQLLSHSRFFYASCLRFLYASSTLP